MPRRPKDVGIALGMALLVLNLHGQPTRAQAPIETGTAAITGAVVDAVTGRPIAGAVLVLAMDEPRPGLPRRAYTQVATPTGRFAFLDLPASEMFVLTASRAGYLDGGYRRVDPRGPSAPIAVRDGQWLRDVRVTMARPGSISGTVVDERREPVVGARVRVLPQVMIAGHMQWLAGAVAQTDDRGAYRIAGLGPGRYGVSVPAVQATLPASATLRPPGGFAGTMADLTEKAADNDAERLLVDVGDGQQFVVGRYAVPPPPAPDGQRMAYPIAFYPNVASPADAAPIELKVSEERSGVDFQLRPVRTTRVSGTVRGSPEAVGNLLLRLMPAGLEEFGQGSEAATTVSLADGRFTFLDVPSGSYVLEARHARLELIYTSTDIAPTVLPAPTPFSARSGGGSWVGVASLPGVRYSSLRDWADVSYWGEIHVEVGNNNVDDLVLPLRRPVSLSGELVWAPGAKPAADRVRPRLEPADGRRSLGVLEFVGLDASRFTLEGLMAGEYVLRVTGAAVESITWDGQDYTERPFDGNGGHDFNGVVVTLTTASSAISGTVRDGATTLTSGAAVIAFPIERERWSNYGFNPRRLKSVLTTSDGRYRLDGLPTGEYYVVAVQAAQKRAWIDTVFLASLATRATRVRIDQSDAKLLNINLSLDR